MTATTAVCSSIDVAEITLDLEGDPQQIIMHWRGDRPAEGRVDVGFRGTEPLSLHMNRHFDTTRKRFLPNSRILLDMARRHDRLRAPGVKLRDSWMHPIRQRSPGNAPYRLG
jgi:hypothetical protein